MLIALVLLAADTTPLAERNEVFYRADLVARIRAGTYRPHQNLDVPPDELRFHEGELTCACGQDPPPPCTFTSSRSGDEETLDLVCGEKRATAIWKWKTANRAETDLYARLGWAPYVVVLERFEKSIGEVDAEFNEKLRQANLGAVAGTWRDGKGGKLEVRPTMEVAFDGIVAPFRIIECDIHDDPGGNQILCLVVKRPEGSAETENRGFAFYPKKRNRGLIYGRMTFTEFGDELAPASPERTFQRAKK